MLTWTRNRSRRHATLICLLLLLVAPLAHASFELTAVRDKHGLGTSSSGIDPLGRSAIAYGSRSLYYAVTDSGGWQIETVELGCGGDRGASLAYDAAGNPAISFHDDADALKLARWDGASTWIIQTIDDAVEVAGATSLAFDLAGEPAIAYYDRTNADLRYASWDGTALTPTVVDGSSGSVGEFPSLAFDDAGNPAIGYYDGGNGDLRLARYVGGVWQIEVVDGLTSDAGRWASLAFDNGGLPALSYAETESAEDIKYAHWNGTAWDLEIVSTTSAARGTSLGFNGAGEAAIAFFHDTGSFSGKLKYATRGATGWSIVNADSQFDAGFGPSLTFDETGNPAISYGDNQNGTLKLTRSDGIAFRAEHVDSGGPSGTGSVAFDGLGRPAVSYGNGQVAGLELARWDGTAWQSETVDPGFWAGSVTSLRFDPAGNPVIAYDDRFGGHIKLARWDGSAWQLEIVRGPSSDPTAPTAPALALDSAGNPGIAYRWPGSFYLDFAHWDGSSWRATRIASGLPFEFAADRCVAFDPADDPAVVYSDWSDQLWIARWNGTGWDNELVDAGPAGLGTIVFDRAGEPLVAYSSSGEVKLARKAGAVWASEVVGLGRPSNIALDPAGEPIIGYLDTGASEVRLARWDGSAWTPETVVAADEAGVLAISAGGSVAVGFRRTAGCRAPEVALSVRSIVVHRGIVSSLTPGWKATAVPLTSLNDDETPPFPSPGAVPGTLTDAFVPNAPLVLYRVLEPGDLAVGNGLRAIPDASGEGVVIWY